MDTYHLGQFRKTKLSLFPYRKVGAILQNVHNFFVRSSTSDFIADTTNLVKQELVTPEYRATSAPEQLSNHSTSVASIFHGLTYMGYTGSYHLIGAINAGKHRNCWRTYFPSVSIRFIGVPILSKFWEICYVQT